MQPETEQMLSLDPMETCPAAHGPSADFICAISEFLDTDPNDLLVELGYYNDSPSQVEA